MKDIDKILHLEHQCPQCGAPIGMLETDHILSCPYCRTHLFMQWPDGISRYFLPSSLQKPTFYVPYWRFRGSEIQLSKENESYGLLDATAIAVRRTHLPRSVGIRAQTIRGKLVGSDLGAPFLEADLPLDEFLASLDENKKVDTGRDSPKKIPPERIISDFYSGKTPRREMIFTQKTMRQKSTENGRLLAQLTHLYASGTTGEKVRHHAFIGETVSMLYFPYFIENNRLHDGLTGRVLSDFPSSEMPGLSCSRPTLEGIQFQPAHCPNCGWDLEGDKQSIVLTCANCLWAGCAGHQRPTSVSYGYWDCSFRPHVWIPFWTLRIESRGIPLSTVGDFRMIANPYTRFSAVAPESQMRFWMPAFKIHPAQLLRIASAITVNQQPPRPPDHRCSREPHLPVTLPHKEAFQAIHLLVASLCRRRKKYFELSAEKNYRLVEVSLAYIPFIRRNMELIQPDINFAIQARAIEQGSNL